jgi:uncharacterized protein (TIGR02996 family)
MSNLRVALEEAIAANPDDLAAHSAYADLLMEQGDPRGEFIQVQLSLEDPACTGDRRQALKRRELDLLTHERDWLGPLGSVVFGPRKYGDGEAGRVSWARGWLESLYLFWFDYTTARALADCPAANILRRLELHHILGYDDSDPPDKGMLAEENIPTDEPFTPLYVLRRAAFLPHLCWLRIGEEVSLEEDFYNSEADGQGLVELLDKTTALEELEVLARGVNLDRLFALDSLTRLRYLVVYHCQTRYPLEVLASNPAFAALQTLRLHPARSDGDGSFLPRADVVTLLHSPHFPALQNLHLHASDLGDEGCQEIVASGILKRLKVLDLRQGCIRDEGARILAVCPDVRRLEYLSLANNELSPAGCALLAGLGINVRLDHQHDPGNDQYQWSGDVE